MFTMGAESKSDRPPTIYDTCAQRYDMYDGIKKLMKYAKGVSAKTHGFDINGNDVDIDYKKMLQIVKESEYQGFIGVEAQAFTMDPIEAIDRDFQYFLDCLREVKQANNQTLNENDIEYAKRFFYQSDK